MLRKLVLIGGVLLSSVAFAQSDSLKVDFSQPVMVGNIQLPAGQCNVSVMEGNANDSVLLFRCGSGVDAMAMTNRISDEGQPMKHPDVVLKRQGDTFQVSQVWFANDDGFQLLK